MLTKEDLARFTSTEQWYRHAVMRNVLYTDGVQYLAQQAHAYWLVDKIATLQLKPHISQEEFQVWRLVVSNYTAVLTCDGDRVTLHSEHITFTDFPLNEIELWVEGGVILLPSEH